MKNKEILLDAIGETDEKLVPELTAKKKRSSIIRWTALGGVCAAAAAVGCIAFLPNDSGKVIAPSSQAEESSAAESSEAQSSQPQESQADTSSDSSSEAASQIEAACLASAVYPEMPNYPDASVITDWDELQPLMNEWIEARNALRDQPEGYQDGFDAFFLNSAPIFLNGPETDNAVYSPLSLYMALGMSAEITDGSSRQQILDALNQANIETLRSHSKSIWQANYLDDGMSKCVLANSFWTNSKARYDQDTVNRLAENYYSSVYSGDPVSEDYTKMFQDWINAQTDGLLGDQVSELKLDPEMLLSIASTVNYSGKWLDKFAAENTEQADFHAAGGDVQCDFMNDERDMMYYWGEHFTSVNLPLENNGQMKLILPDEGYTPYDLLNDEQAGQLMLNTGDYQDSKFASVKLSIPKFDVASNISLQQGLEELGITDIFDISTSDFTPLTGEKLYINKAEQDTRVTVDEEGCKAVSVTIIGGKGGGGAPDEQAEFILDRPFIFEIMSDTGLPLFMGVVNNPAQ